MKVAFFGISFALLVGISPSANAWFVGTQAGGQWLQSHTPEVLEEDRTGEGEEALELRDDCERGEELGDERLVEEALTE